MSRPYDWSAYILQLRYVNMHPTERHDTVRMSKCLARMLRHRPDLPHDEFGWMSVDELAERGSMTKEQILELGETDSRYELSPEGDMIRACHGHSFEINYDEEVVPPETLYHGTSPKGFEGIVRSGSISRMSRTKVHLSDDEEKALCVGGRHCGGNPILLRVDSGRMHRAGMKFQISQDGVYLTDKVPLRYVERLQGGSVRHTMHLKPLPFDRILSGEKTVELRLFDDKRRMIREGDSIVFTCDDRSLIAKVVALHRFPDFVSLYGSLPKRMLGYRDDEYADPKHMEEYYGANMDASSGVLGIEISLQDQM